MPGNIKDLYMRCFCDIFNFCTNLRRYLYFYNFEYRYTLDLPKALQIDIFSKIPTNGTTSIPDPKFSIICKKPMVPFRAPSCGNSGCGNPGGMYPSRQV